MPPSAESAQRKLSERRAANPVTWLKSMLDGMSLPEPVRAHVNQLFKGHTKYIGVKPDSVWPVAMRIACRLNWARAQYELLQTSPSDPKHFSLSKVASMWAINEAKFKGLNKSQGGKVKSRIELKVPPTRASE